MTALAQVRTLADVQVLEQALVLAEYLRKPGSRGASSWLTSKGLGSADRAAILLALGDQEDAA